MELVGPVPRTEKIDEHLAADPRDFHDRLVDVVRVHRGDSAVASRTATRSLANAKSEEEAQSLVKRWEQLTEKLNAT